MVAGKSSNRGFLLGPVKPAFDQGPMKPRAKVNRCCRGLAEERQRDDAVRVHGEDRHVDAASEGGRGLGNRGAREIVGDHRSRATGGLLHETCELALLAFDERPVAEPATGRSARVLRHAVEDESVMARAREGTRQGQGLEEHEGNAQLACQGQGIVESMVALEAPCRLAPVENEGASANEGSLVQSSKTRLTVAHLLQSAVAPPDAQQ